METFRKSTICVSFLFGLLSCLHLSQGETESLIPGATTQTVRSPGYPNNYANNLDCTWDIQALSGTKVLIIVTELDTEECCDYVEIHENGVSVAKFQGSSQVGIPFISSTSHVTLKFKSDHSQSAKGFAATYKQVQSCGAKLTAVPQSRTFSSPNHPAAYPANSDCYWEITTTTSTKHVELKIEQGATFGANDYVSIYEGQQRVAYVEGGLNVLQTFSSSDQKLIAYFHSDAAANSGGFRATYKEISCGGTFPITNFMPAIVTSPGYPFFSSDNLQCTYVIQAETGNTVEVVLDIDTEACCDYVEVFDGQTSLGTIRGNSTDRIFRSTGQTLRLRYVTDESFTEPGFRARYRQIGKPVVINPTGVSTCSATGDPHYTTFDGATFDFHGICSYTLIDYKPKGKKPTGKNSQSFSVEVFQEHRTGPTVAYIHKVQITVGKITLQLCKNKMLKARYSATAPFVTKATPFSYGNGAMKVWTSGSAIKFKSNFGLEVQYDTPSNVWAILSNSYSGKITGLCGDLNGVSNDDFPLNPYVQSKRRYFLAKTYADALKTESKKPNMNCNHIVDTGECSTQDKAKYSVECSLLTNTNDPIFSDCNQGPNPAVDPTQYFEDCVFDACASANAYQAIADNFYEYTKKCKAKPGITIGNWKKRLNLEPVCKANSHFELCGPSCPATCTEQNPNPCPGTDEGCFCDDGFVLSNDNCVKVADCGCELDGEYYTNNQVFYTTMTCTTKCTCSQGTLTCVSAPCSAEEMCGISAQTGEIACVPTSSSTATGSGDPHYTSFDKRRFDFMGVGTFTMVQTDSIPNTNDRWLVIEAENERRYGSTRVSYIKAVTVKLLNGQFLVQMEKNNVVKVNGAVVEEYESDLFKVRTAGRTTVLTTKYFVTVKYAYDHFISVTLPSSYSSKISGLFGNYNGNPADDIPSQFVRNINNFGRRFQVGERAEYPSAQAVARCSPANDRRWRGASYCGRLLGSAFTQCRQMVSVGNYLNDCVFDVCENNGNRAILEKSLEDYALACQAEGVKLCNWRHSTGFRAFTCPANSHYEGCATPCPDTCLDPYASDDCDIQGTVEACVCNAGFVKEGNNCVRLSECKKTTAEGLPPPPPEEEEEEGDSCIYTVDNVGARLSTFTHNILGLRLVSGALQVELKQIAEGRGFGPIRVRRPITGPSRTRLNRELLIALPRQQRRKRNTALEPRRIEDEGGSGPIRIRRPITRPLTLEPNLISEERGSGPIRVRRPTTGPLTKAPPREVRQICSIDLVAYRKGDVTFRVSVESEGAPRSYHVVKKLIVNYKGTDVQIYRGRTDAMVNSRTVQLPYASTAQGIRIARDPTRVTVRTDAGMTVSYDLNEAEVVTTLPRAKAKKISGWCVTGDRLAQNINAGNSQLPSLLCII